MDKKNKNTFFVAVLSIIQKIFGLLKTLLLSFFFGSGAVTDSFDVVTSASSTIDSILGNGIRASYVPVAEPMENENKNSFTSSLLSIYFLIAGFLCILCFVFPELIIYAFAPGFDETAVLLTKDLIRIGVWSVLFMGGSQILTSFLNTKRRFIGAAAATLLIGIFECVGVFLSYKFNNLFLAIGVFAGTFLQFFVLLLLAFKNGFSVKFKPNELNAVKRIALLSIPILISTSASRINVIIDKALASTMGSGFISALSYADIVVLFIKTIFVVSVLTVAFPQITKLCAFHVEDEYHREISDTLNRIVFFVVPITVASFVVGDDLIRLIFGRGNFGEEWVLIVSNIFKIYIIGLLAVSVRDLFVNINYANKDTKSPTINVVIGITINVALNFLLGYFFKVYGLAIASVISSWIICFLMILTSKKYVKLSFFKPNLFFLTKVAVSSLMMLVVLLLFHCFVGPFFQSFIFRFFVEVLIGTGVYFISSYVFKLFRLSDILKFRSK